MNHVAAMTHRKLLKRPLDVKLKQQMRSLSRPLELAKGAQTSSTETPSRGRCLSCREVPINNRRADFLDSARIAGDSPIGSPPPMHDPDIIGCVVWMM
jgi:hypothetical protein